VRNNGEVDAGLVAALAASVAALGTAATTLVVSRAELRSQHAALDALQETLRAIKQGMPGADQTWFWTPEWQAGATSVP